ncbi:hypothetical protein LCGC14_0666670 [marine sediment metagenome]|uniref:Uncharacterized protein n=1 Tax=marine sediment metagenome TaxID=412755 RepID=A0A0F9U089_9ZZZZ
MGSETDSTGVTVIEPLKADDIDIDPDDLNAIAEARIPLSQNPRKADYLSYRAVGFSIRESLALAAVTQATLNKWRREDKEFLQFEQERLAFLQRTISGDIMRMRWLRNFFLVLRRDERILHKSAFNFEGLTDNERAYLHLIRKHYTPQDLLALEKALEPEHGERARIAVDKAIFIVDGKEVVGDDNRRAASRAVLDRFNANAKYAEVREAEE